MNKRLCSTLLVMSCVLGGCAPYAAEEGHVKEALQQKEAAYIRLAKAITSYCTTNTETLDARDACIVEQRLLTLEPGNARPTLPTGVLSSELRSAR